MYDFIQSALTATIEAIAFITVIGLPAHYIVTSHVREVKSWGVPHTTPAVKAEVEPQNETPTDVVKPRSKKAPQPKLQPLSVGAAAVDYSVLTSEQLRKECGLQSVNWRTGGDYGKPMKKSQMLAALT